MRVNVVRRCGEFKNNGSLLGAGEREIEGFYDQSLWESRKLNGEDSLKNLIRDGVHNTSVVCVLAGSETFTRPWVRYEIARAVIDGRGLLTVHINTIRHHSDGRPHPIGNNPLDFMGVVKLQPTLLSISQYYLCERDKYGEWQRYSKYTLPVPMPKFLLDPDIGYVMPLSAGTKSYDYANNSGHLRIGDWLDEAAQAAGR
ncbi:MAG: hypothetical protein RLZZ187_3650 [Pseudomonadota bacterium]